LSLLDTGPAMDDDALTDLRGALAAAGHPVYLGAGPGGLAYARPQQSVLVLGPPRSGKTSSIVIPVVVSASGLVVSTSTKTEVMEVTVAARAGLGRAWLFDPSATVACPPGVRPLRWSPVPASASWDGAVLMARSLVQSSRPSARLVDGGHWEERAEALLAPLLHAAAVAGATASDVLRWVHRRQLGDARQLLDEGGHDPGTLIAADVLAGLAATEDRELSGIWSTAAGALAAYRGASALAAADRPNCDPAALVDSADTVYVCASSRHQAMVAPLVVGFLEELRAATYARPPGRPPVVLALDEVANVAPLPDLPAMVSEGGGQGLVTLACLQDLSQARVRWGAAAEGFLSLFGTTVVLPGIGDLRTLEAVSLLCGETEVPTVSATSPPWPSVAQRTSLTVSTRRQRRVPPEQVAHAQAGTAWVLDGPRGPSRIVLTPWYAWPTFGRLTAPDVGPRALSPPSEILER
jgi:type IV secretory pathway TraG/TraD family ATPase VirD4